MSDIISNGTSKDIAKEIGIMEARFAALVDIYDKDDLGTGRAFLLSNLARACGLQLHRLQKWVLLPSDLSAWCARNLFEINLIIRWILQSEANEKAWCGEIAHDEADIFEGIAKLAEGSQDPNREALLNRCGELRTWADSKGLPRRKSKSVMHLAETVGLKSEYEAFFKLYSKYVHPSSFFLNGDRDSVFSQEIFNILITQAQLYAADSYGRLEKSLNKASAAARYPCGTE